MATAKKTPAKKPKLGRPPRAEHPATAGIMVRMTHEERATIEAGAAAPERTGTAADLHAWLRAELPRVTRPLKHTGNFRYLFGLTSAVRKRLPKGLPYPKFTP